MQASTRTLSRGEDFACATPFAAAAAAPTAVDANRPSARLYFLHIPKTAGTSVRHWLEDLFGAADWFPCYILDEVRRFTRDEINRYRFFSGHFGWGFRDQLDQPTPVVTWLRDPVARELSSYRYNRAHGATLRQVAREHGRGSWLDYYELQQRCSLSECCRSELYLGFSDNLQTRYLAGLFPSNDPLPVDERALDRARSRLQSLFFVGISEWMDASIELLCHRLACPWRPMNLNLNRSAREEDEAKLAAEWAGEDLEYLRDVNRYDQQLYEFARGLVRQRWEALAARCGVESPRLVNGRPRRDPRLPAAIDAHFQSVRRGSIAAVPQAIDFAGPAFLRGWNSRTDSPQGLWMRWAGPEKQSALFARLAAGGDYRMTFLVRWLPNVETLRTLRIRVNATTGRRAIRAGHRARERHREISRQRPHPRRGHRARRRLRAD